MIQMLVQGEVKDQTKQLREVIEHRLQFMAMAMDRLNSESMARTFEARTNEDRITVLVEHLVDDVYPLTPNPGILRDQLDARFAEMYASRAEELRLRKLPSEILVTAANGSDAVVTACVDETEEQTTVTILVEHLPAARAYQGLHGVQFVEGLKRDAMGQARLAVSRVAEEWKQEPAVLGVVPELGEDRQ